MRPLQVNGVCTRKMVCMYCAAEVLKAPAIMNTAVQGLMLTPVVSRPHDKVMVYERSGSLPMALFTICNASAFSSSSSPLPATLTIWNAPNTGCCLSLALSTRAAFTPGTTQRVCRKMLRKVSQE